jgi:hypothetical protein
LKKAECSKQVELAFADAQADCTGGAVVFTRDDLEKAFGRGQAEAGEAVRQELETFYRMAGVFVQMLLFEAEQQGVTLRADVNYMENYKALEELKDFERLNLSASSLGSGEGGIAPLKKKAGVGKLLPGLGAAMAMSQEQTLETQ